MQNDGPRARSSTGRKAMTPSFRFFRNVACEYFPCHTTDDPEAFNCLFCYCPLYFIRGCGGDGVIRPDGVKDCSGCLVPHKPENYERIIRRLKAAIREAAMCEEDARERTPMPNKRANHVLPRLSRSAGK